MPLPDQTRRPSNLSADTTPVVDFAGIINTKTHKEVGFKGLTVAQNLEIDNDKRLLRRNGFTLASAGAYRTAYATEDQSKMFAVIGTDLVRVLDDFTTRVLKSGLSLAMPPSGFSWSEDASNYVSYTNGVDSGIIRNGLDWIPLSIDRPTISSATLTASGAHVSLPFHIGDGYTMNTFRIFCTYSAVDGRESAPSAIWEIAAPPESARLSINVPAQYAQTNLYACEPGGDRYFLIGSSTAPTFTATSDNLTALAGPDWPYTTAVEPMPAGCQVIRHDNGHLYVAEYIADRNMSVVWCSLPLQYHLFNKTGDYFFTVIGQVQLMLSTAKGLLIGTDNQVYAWHEGKLTELTQYGVVPGVCGDVLPNGVAYFWTLRGPAKYPDYELLTEETFSGDPGVFNHAHLFLDHGYVKLIASTVTGNPAFNQRTER